LLILKRLVGMAVMVAGIVGFAVYVFALADPHGSKLADDGDPFGDPGSRWAPIVGMLVSGAVAGVGLYVVVHSSRQSP
jgi:hypothetical protein